MYGADMGTLNIDISTDNGSTYATTLWSQSGNVQSSSSDSWLSVNLNLSAYIGSTVKIRLQGITGSGYRSDISVDNVSLLEVIPAPEIELQGNSLEIINGDNTPSNTDYIDFGTANIGTLINRTYTIYNTGDLDLTISSISLSNSTDFSITGTPYSTPIPSGNSTTFTITFDSLTIGTKTSTITINNDDIDESSYEFDIQASAEQNFFDSDNDGVLDNVDVDDDNDGILDSEEELACQDLLIINS